MRVVRLIRLIKLFKHVNIQGPPSTPSGKLQRKSRLSQFTPQVKQSHVGLKLSELTTKRVVIGVLSMVLVLPFLDVSNTIYGEKPALAEEGLHMLHAQAVLDPGSALFQSGLEVRRLAGSGS